MPKCTRALLTTNGMLLNKMSDAFWEVIKEHDIKIYVSVYPKKIDYQGMVTLAKSKGVTLLGLEYPVLGFERVALAEDKRYDSKYAYSLCKITCMQVRDGRLYPCSYSAYVEFVNKHYGTAFVHEKGDYLNTDEITDGRMVTQWMDEPKPFCAYCSYGNHSRRPWKSTGTHDMDEWVER